MGFQDVAFLSSRAGFCITFLKNHGRGESLRTTTCLITVVGVSKGMLLLNASASTRPVFVSVEIDGNHKTVTKMR